MFLLRTVFTLSLVVLVLPTDARQQEKLSRNAKQAAQYVAGFCDRNASSCEAGSRFFTAFQQKAGYGFQLAMNIVTGQPSEDASGSGRTNGVNSSHRSRPFELSKSDHGTLRPRDLTPPWRGRGVQR